MSRPRKYLDGGALPDGRVLEEPDPADAPRSPSLGRLLEDAIKSPNPRAHAAAEAVRLSYLDLLARAQGVSEHLAPEILARIKEL